MRHIYSSIVSVCVALIFASTGCQHTSSSVPVANYLNADEKAGDKIVEILKLNQIECVAFGSLGYTVSVPKEQAEKARKLLLHALKEGKLKSTVYDTKGKLMDTIAILDDNGKVIDWKNKSL